MTFHYRYRKQLLIGFSLTVILSFISIGIYFKWFHPKDKIENEKVMVLSKKEEMKKESSEKKEFYYVDIKGQVVSPGLYLVDKNSRVMDAITQAGGLLETADTSVLNLGKKVFDEMVIVVYSVDEVANFIQTKEIENKKYTACVEQQEIHNDACVEVEQKKEQSEKVSLNTATEEQLLSLPGIGEAKAKDIIKYRNEKGSFQTVEDIMKVSGIGESLFAKIKDYLII